MSGHVVVATGVEREAACLARIDGVVAIPGGGDPVALRQRLEAAAKDAAGIMSFGMAGALSDDLGIGDWVVGERLCGAVTADCDVRWREAILSRLPVAQTGTVFADGTMIATVARKQALARDQGAMAVDMESHVAAIVAREAGLPFAILRCISDRADHAMPHAITVSMKADGKLDGAAIARSLVTRPGQIPALVLATIGFARAMRALRNDAPTTGARMGLRQD